MVSGKKRKENFENLSCWLKACNANNQWEIRTKEITIMKILLLNATLDDEHRLGNQLRIPLRVKDSKNVNQPALV